MIYNLGLLSDIGNAVIQAFRTLSGSIAALLFDFLTYLYDIFILLTNVEILDNDFVNAIYTKVGLILGIFMLFKLTFSLIQALVDPKKIDDTSSKGIRNVVLRLIVAIILLGFTPAIFREAMSLQRAIIGSDSGSSTNNIIYKLIVGGTSGVNPKTFGRQLASDVFFSFYRDDNEPYYNNGASAYDETVDVRYQEVNYEQIRDVIEKGTSFNYAVTPLALKDSGGEYLIEYDGFFVLIIGGLLIWVIFMYCFQVAVRVFKLAFLQLIAPVPILSFISDPDGTFKKWWQACLSTYLDLFIRLAIIYFVIYLSSYVLNQLNNVNSIINASLPNDFMIRVWIKMFLLVALLLFANKLPDLLKELFPNLGGGNSYGLSFKKEVLDPSMKSAKALWDSPLGWLPKLGLKTATYIDRKMYGLPAPRGKVGQAIDKVLPGRGEAIKNRRAARIERDKNEQYLKDGEKLYNNFGGKLDSSAFKHADYRDSFDELSNAKKAKKSAEEVLENLQTEYQDAYRRSADPRNDKYVQGLYQQVQNARSNVKAAEGRVTTAQQRHDDNKKIYVDDADREAKFDYYKKTHEPLKDVKSIEQVKTETGGGIPINPVAPSQGNPPIPGVPPITPQGGASGNSSMPSPGAGASPSPATGGSAVNQGAASGAETIPSETKTQIGNIIQNTLKYAYDNEKNEGKKAEIKKALEDYEKNPDQYILKYYKSSPAYQAQAESNGDSNGSSQSQATDGNGQTSNENSAPKPSGQSSNAKEGTSSNTSQSQTTNGNGQGSNENRAPKPSGQSSNAKEGTSPNASQGQAANGNGQSSNENSAPKPSGQSSNAKEGTSPNASQGQAANVNGQGSNENSAPKSSGQSNNARANFDYNEYVKLVNMYNEEKDPIKRQQIKKQIEDFEKKH